MSLVQFENVSKIYTTGDHVLRALDQVSFTLDEGKFIVILGPSGAGKSTLLNLLGGLDSPSEGTITVAGADISKLTDNELADYRASTVGFVFQFYNLIPTLTVYENVKLVSEISKNALDAKEMIDKVGLGPLTYIVSILLTFGVSLLVGWMVARKNRKIDMVEALKNAE